MRWIWILYLPTSSSWCNSPDLWYSFRSRTLAWHCAERDAKAASYAPQYTGRLDASSKGSLNETKKERTTFLLQKRSCDGWVCWPRTTAQYGKLSSMLSGTSNIETAWQALFQEHSDLLESESWPVSHYPCYQFHQLPVWAISSNSILNFPDNYCICSTPRYTRSINQMIYLKLWLTNHGIA